MNVPDGRICRCCNNLAVALVKSQYLCPECLQKRRHRQQAQAAIPKCRCGNNAKMGESMCSRCRARLNDANVKREFRSGLRRRIDEVEDHTVRELLHELMSLIEEVHHA